MCSKFWTKTISYRFSLPSFVGSLEGIKWTYWPTIFSSEKKILVIITNHPPPPKPYMQFCSNTAIWTYPYWKLYRKYFWSTRYVQHLPVPELIPFFLWCPCSSFSFPWVFFSPRLLLFVFNVFPYNFLDHTFLWLSYTFVQIILSDTYRYFRLDKLLKALSWITLMLLWFNRL